MGYAAGVGKTWRMLDELGVLSERGIDAVLGYFESHGRADTIAKASGLELIPRGKIAYRGTEFEEMDTEAILFRRPAVCGVDELPHTNVPGSKRAKRWEDVELLLQNGIDILTTMNIQHLESLSDQVFQITGVRVRETVPDWVVQRANEVVMVDVTPRALIHRLERGVVYGTEKAQSALQNFFREPTLVALRELAMRETAKEVAQHTTGAVVEAGSAGPNQTHHKILVLVTAEPESAMLIRRAKRVGDFIGAECYAVAVHPEGNLDALPPAERESIERHLNFARNLHIEARVVAGDDTAQALVDFARLNQITQIFLGRPQARRFLPRISRTLVEQIVGLAKDMQIVIVSEREPLKPV